MPTASFRSYTRNVWDLGAECDAYFVLALLTIPSDDQSSFLSKDLPHKETTCLRIGLLNDKMESILNQ